MRVANEIRETVERFAKEAEGWSDAEFSHKKNAATWSAKEIIGHLVDSAQNNIQRFIRGQYENKPAIVYAQEEWVRLQGYQTYAKADLLQLWVSLNRHLARILIEMNPANYECEVNTGDTRIELHSLFFLAEDYLKHMVHHLNQLKERIKN